MANFRLILASIALLSGIATALVKPNDAISTNAPPPATGSNTEPTSHVAPTSDAAPTAAIQQKIIWGYVYSPDLLPYPDWQRTLEPGKAYRLYDEHGKCIGSVKADGTIELIHDVPTTCPPAGGTNG